MKILNKFRGKRNLSMLSHSDWSKWEKESKFYL